MVGEADRETQGGARLKTRRDIAMKRGGLSVLWGDLEAAQTGPFGMEN